MIIYDLLAQLIFFSILYIETVLQIGKDSLDLYSKKVKCDLLSIAGFFMGSGTKTKIEELITELWYLKLTKSILKGPSIALIYYFEQNSDTFFNTDYFYLDSLD